MLETDRHDELRGSNWSKGLTIDGIFRAFGHIKASELHHVMLFSSARLRTAAVLNVLFVVSVSNQNWFCHHFFNQFFGTDMNWIIQRNPKKKAGFHTPKQLKQKTVLGVSFWVLNCHFCPCYCHPAAWFTVMGVTRSVENQLKISWKSVENHTQYNIYLWPQICRAGWIKDLQQHLNNMATWLLAACDMPCITEHRDTPGEWLAGVELNEVHFTLSIGPKKCWRLDGALYSDTSSLI